MPFYDFVNIEDSNDVWEDAFYGSHEEIPETLEKDGKIYHYKPSYPTADTIFKVSKDDACGWTPTSKVSYSSPEELRQLETFKQMKAKRYEDRERLGITDE